MMSPLTRFGWLAAALTGCSLQIAPGTLASPGPSASARPAATAATAAKSPSPPATSGPAAGLNGTFTATGDCADPWVMADAGSDGRDATLTHGDVVLAGGFKDGMAVFTGPSTVMVIRSGDRWTGTIRTGTADEAPFALTPCPSSDRPAVAARHLRDSGAYRPYLAKVIVLESEAEIRAFEGPTFSGLVPEDAPTPAPIADWAAERVVVVTQAAACDDFTFDRVGGGVRVGHERTCLRGNNEPFASLFAVPRADGPIVNGTAFAEVRLAPVPTYAPPTPTPGPG